jgi:methylenetetrahydrofolate dehydrogenase (NADP+)/methenyltetrahydrofolate cyclohydrolase
VSARIIDGRLIAAAMRARLAEKIALLPFRPSLAVVLVGGDPASSVYVRSKDRAASAVGIAARTIELPADISEEELITRVARLNADPAVDGILVQLPLPAHVTAQAVVEAVDPEKDVDGFHPLNVGRLASGHPGLVPCTPLGVMKLLAEARIALEGARALIWCHCCWAPMPP